ncbi:MAG: rod-binding protein [Bdellovibrionales bacterium]
MIGAVLPTMANDLTTMGALPSALAAKAALNNTNIAAAAEDFEAMFATQLLKPMFDTVPVNGIFGGGNGEEVMRTFLLQEYGKMIAKTGCLGIASQVKAEMLRAQENAKGRGTSPSAAKNQSSPSSPETKMKGTPYASSR